MPTSSTRRRDAGGQLATILLLAVVALAACRPTASGPTNSSPGGSEGTAAPLASRIFATSSALQAQLALHRPTVLLFTYSGCPTCAAEVKVLEQAMAAHPGVQAIGIDMLPDAPDVLRSFLERERIADAPFLWVIDSDRSIIARYQLQVVQFGVTVGIDRGGAVRFKNLLPASADQLGKQLAALVKG